MFVEWVGWLILVKMVVLVLVVVVGVVLYVWVLSYDRCLDLDW